MGKSYKKTPINKDGNRSKKEDKKIASRTIRRKAKQGLEIGGGNEYKKHYNSWNIADNIQRWTKEEAIAEYNNLEKGVERWPGQAEYFKEHYPTLEDFLNYWEKCMRRK